MSKLWFVSLLICVSAFGQSNYAGLGGTVMDPQGKAFAGAELQLTASSTQAVRRTTTNDQGIFEITGLLPGDYELKVQAPGFSPLTQSLRLEVGQRMALNLALKVASVQNVVEVGDIAPALHSTDSSVPPQGRGKAREPHRCAITPGEIAGSQPMSTTVPATERPAGSVDPKLLEILVCPLTKGPLEYEAAKQELISRKAKLAYPIRDGIPIMLPEEARRLE